MRLLNTSSLQLLELPPFETRRYAILSHTWEEDEVLFDEILRAEGNSNDSIAIRRKKGFKKIVNACKRVAEDQHEYLWIDTCCINKPSNTELSEAINSMFRWYRDAEMCYAYLADVDYSSSTAPKSSRWFTRGWTLQELLAPTEVTFVDCHWRTIGTRSAMANMLQDITGIDEAVLKGKSFSEVSVAQRMSWASQRQTTRVEDRAYSLLGLFGVNMPMMYGERENAFIRLQQAILRRSDDTSIFDWTKSASRSQTIQDLLAWRHKGSLGPQPASYLRKYWQIQQSLLAPTPDSFIRPSSKTQLKNIRTPGEFSDSGLGPSVPTERTFGIPSSNFEPRLYETAGSERNSSDREDFFIASIPQTPDLPANASNRLFEDEPTDDDLQSILTHPDDVDSLAPSDPSVLLRHAETHIASILMMNESWRRVCQEAHSIVGRGRSCRQIMRLLKYLYLGLCESSTDDTQKTAISFLRSRWSRSRIADHVLEALNSEAEVDEENLTSQEEVDKNIMMERFLAQLDVNHHSMRADEEVELSDSDSDNSSEGPAEEEFKKLRELEDFLQRSPALPSMTYDLSRFLLPASLIELSGRMVSVPSSDISFSETGSTSWGDAIKRFCENITAETWDWHPLLPPKRGLGEHEARVCWNCVCQLPFSLADGFAD